MNNPTHLLAAGVIVIENDNILLVRDQHGWSLPKGSVEQGELMKETAEREAREETGWNVEIKDVAFITEYRSQQYGRYLQVYYSAKIRDKVGKTQDPDNDVEEILFVPKTQVREYIQFRPWILPLQNWIQDPTTKYYSFDLDLDADRYYL